MYKKCKVCSKEIKCFKSTEHKHIYCSNECRKRITHITVRCRECDTVYSVAKSRYNGGFLRHKFCSDRCYSIMLRRKKERSIMNKTYKCMNCGKTFTSYRQSKVFKFCSQDCSKRFMKGNNSFAYKDGSTIGSNGYKYVKIGDKYILEHRLIVEEYIGRKLSKEEDVHHVDGDKLNNDIDNLKIMSKGDHAKHHHIKRIKNSKPCIQ